MRTRDFLSAKAIKTMLDPGRDVLTILEECRNLVDKLPPPEAIIHRALEAKTALYKLAQRGDAFYLDARDNSTSFINFRPSQISVEALLDIVLALFQAGLRQKECFLVIERLALPLDSLTK
jgi:hypothetical protein